MAHSNSHKISTTKSSQKEQKAVELFIGTTSFHGLIQAYHNRKKIDKISWLVCLVICSAGFMGHLYLIVTRYLDLPTTIDMVSMMNYDPFPALTVCPMSFISSAKTSKYMFIPQFNFNNLTLYDLINLNIPPLWKKLYQRQGKDMNDSAVIGKYTEDIDTSIYRFQKLMSFSISRQNYEMIFFCEINNKPCSWRNFVEFDHPIYKRCFKFQYISSAPNEIPRKLIMGVYVDDDYRKVSEDIKTMLAHKGGKVTLNEIDVFPGTVKPFESFSSGFHHIFRVKQVGSSKINKERSPCEVKTKSTFSILNDYEYDGTTNIVVNYKYNTILCRQYQQQIECVRRCSCLNHKIPVFLDAISISSKKLIFCNEMQIIFNVNNTIKRLDCINSLDYDKDFNDRLIVLCPELCEQTEYQIYSYIIPWFDKTLIKETNFVGEKLRQHVQNFINSTTVTDMVSLNKAITCLEASLKDITKASQCFSLIIVQFESPRKEITREYQAYLLANLLSDFGGVLGLWVGVSLITIIEIIHVTISLSRHRTKRAVSSFRKSIKKISLKSRSNPQEIGIANESFQKDKTDQCHPKVSE